MIMTTMGVTCVRIWSGTCAMPITPTVHTTAKMMVTSAAATSAKLRKVTKRMTRMMTSASGKSFPRSRFTISVNSERMTGSPLSVSFCVAPACAASASCLASTARARRRNCVRSSSFDATSFVSVTPIVVARPSGVASRHVKSGSVVAIFRRRAISSGGRSALGKRRSMRIMSMSGTTSRMVVSPCVSTTPSTCASSSSSAATRVRP